MLKAAILCLTLATPILCDNDGDVTRSALSLDRLVGSRVVADSESSTGVEVVGTVEDLIVDAVSGAVARIVVRDVMGAAQDSDEGAEPPLRSVPLDDVTIAPSGKRAIVTFGLTAEDYRVLPTIDLERELQPVEGQPTRRVTATSLRGAALVTMDGTKLGSVTDVWLDVAADRIDFVEHEVSGGAAGAPFSVVKWTFTEGAAPSGEVQRDSEFVLAIPRISPDDHRTLKHRDYRALLRTSYGVKQPDTDA
ncbi:MAG: PRC-barrel domain-containing protein [Planctomycetota bacterium]